MRRLTESIPTTTSSERKQTVKKDNRYVYVHVRFVPIQCARKFYMIVVCHVKYALEFCHIFVQKPKYT